MRRVQESSDEPDPCSASKVTKPPTVYFYCRDGEAHLQEDVVALAEGFRDLGVPFFANCNYWHESPCSGDFLVRRDAKITAADCDIVVVGYTWPSCLLLGSDGSFHEFRRSLPADLFAPGRRAKRVFVDNHDGWLTVSWQPEFRQFDLVLRSKLNARAWHPKNFAPWALGLNARILRATAGGPAFAQRRRSVLVNYGASHPYDHGTRALWRNRVEPTVARTLAIDRTRDDLSVEPADAYEKLMWRQTGHRYSAAYYERLKNAQAVACFCGELIPGLPFRAEALTVGGRKALLRRKFYAVLARALRRPPRSVQWDSFRFWEALAAGCVAINIDLERYGVTLPVMPTNFEHYVGIDVDRPEAALAVLEDEAKLEQIATNGRAWALAHYSPAAQARRLLAYCGMA